MFKTTELLLLHLEKKDSIFYHTPFSNKGHRFLRDTFAILGAVTSSRHRPASRPPRDVVVCPHTAGAAAGVGQKLPVNTRVLEAGALHPVSVGNT